MKIAGFFILKLKVMAILEFFVEYIIPVIVVGVFFTVFCFIVTHFEDNE